MAVIMCDTGIALLAYMDGLTGSPTVGGVVLAAAAAAGSAVYKVSLLEGKLMNKEIPENIFTKVFSIPVFYFVVTFYSRILH